MSKRKDEKNPPLDLQKLTLKDEMPSLMKSVEKEAIHKMALELEQKKEEILRTKLIKMGKNPEFLDQQKKRRFKDIVCEKTQGLEDQEETWWLNDGTLTGQRIITFRMVRDFPSVDSDVRLREVSIGFKYEYY